MSSYTVRVRQADSLHGTFACDGVYVDGGGNLKVNRVQRPGDDLLTVARFQHGHWASYTLEPTGEPDIDDSTDAPAKAEVLPEVGETVHVWRPNDVLGGCVPLRVAGRDTTAPGLDTILVLDGPLPWSDRFQQYLTRNHDEARIAPGSWHWPCSSNCQNAEPEPPAPAVIRIDLRGVYVTSEDDIDRLTTEVAAAISKRFSTGIRIQ